MTVGSYDKSTAPARISQIGTDIEQSSCGILMATGPCGCLAMCHCFSVSCCFLFYTFEVPSQSKIRYCACLVHEYPKIHDDRIASVRSPHVLRTEAAQAPCDIPAISMSGGGDCTMTV